MLITFEGIDGCGKTTQLDLLRSWLKEQGKEAIITREPGGTVLGEKIRSLLLSTEEGPKTAMAELLLYLAARAELVETVIVPALNAGEIVIADRFSDSTWAYQVYGRELRNPWITALLTGAIGGLKPDLTLLFDLTPSVALERIDRNDRMEREGVGFFGRVREGYLALAQKEPDRIRVIDAQRTTGEIWADVQVQITSLLK